MASRKPSNLETLAYSVPQAATVLNVSDDAVRALVKRGDLPALRIGSRILIAKVALAEWVDANRGATFAGVNGEAS